MQFGMEVAVEHAAHSHQRPRSCCSIRASPASCRGIACTCSSWCVDTSAMQWLHNTRSQLSQQWTTPCCLLTALVGCCLSLPRDVHPESCQYVAHSPHRCPAQGGATQACAAGPAVNRRTHNCCCCCTATAALAAMDSAAAGAAAPTAHVVCHRSRCSLAVITAHTHTGQAEGRCCLSLPRARPPLSCAQANGWSCVTAFCCAGVGIHPGILHLPA